MGMNTRVCNTCGEDKPLSAYRAGWKCRACTAEYMREYAAKNKARLSEYKRQWAHENTESRRASEAAYRERNRDKEAARARKRRQDQPEAVWAAVRRWREENRERFRQQMLRRQNRLVAAAAMLTPADDAEIERCFETAAGYRLFGVDCHVDHIIPLAGDQVSGLHVPWNLRIVPASHNRKKHTKWDEREAVASSVTFEDWINYGL